MSFAMALSLSSVAVLACFLYAYVGSMSQKTDDSWSSVVFYATVYLTLYTALTLGVPLP